MTARRLMLLLCAACALGACDDGPPTVAVDASAPVDATPPDADAIPTPSRKPPGALCAPGECARGSCVNGVCSALCARDADCDPATPLCVGRGGAGRCSARCASAADCAPGLVCAVVDVDAGICVAPGEGGAGAPCTSREDCASWFCAEGRCAGACDDGACADGRCVALHTQSICIPTGPAPAEAVCADGVDCASGVCRGGRCADVCPDGQCADDRVCLRYPTADLCERRCADSGDCGDSAVCLLVGRQRLCVTRGPAAAGERCDAHADCASGRCDLGQCSAPCVDGDCPPGTACVVDIAGPACRPAGPAAAGARCEAGPVCASGVCGGGVCTADCAAGACPEGTRCAAFADGAFCFPACAADADCPGPAFCDARFEAGPICFWRGPADTGDACADHRDCASGRCAEGRCLAACTAECPAGQRCVSIGPGRFCAAPPLPEDAACDPGDDCADGLACVAGRCLPDCAAGCPALSGCLGARCHPRCADDLDCRPGRVCDRLAGGLCVDPGAGGTGSTCASAADCADGLCLDGRCRGRCVAACPAGQACLGLGPERWCVPAGAGAVGDRCGRHADCGSGLCLGRRCAGPCDDGVPCPAGTACRDRFGGRWCVGVCGPDAPCGAGEVCDPAGDRYEGQCVAAPASPSVGAPCADDADCGPAAVGCADGADGRRCRAPCAVGGDDCPAGEACAPRAMVAEDGALGGCVPAGAGDALAACGADGECGSGWCVEGYLDGRCGVPCRTDADCGPARCVDLARDPAAPLRVCARRCDGDADCAAPLRCRRDLAGDGACY